MSDWRYRFACSCGAWHARSGYCIAQQAMGNTITFTCPKCEKKMVVPPLEERW